MITKDFLETSGCLICLSVLPSSIILLNIFHVAGYGLTINFITTMIVGGLVALCGNWFEPIKTLDDFPSQKQDSVK